MKLIWLISLGDRVPFITYKTLRKYQNMIILGSKKADPGLFQSVYIEMNGILPLKKMNNLTKLDMKLFRIVYITIKIKH